MKVLLIFGLLSLLIAGTGLFALSGFLMHQKMAAAAIRKVSGASVGKIMIPEFTQYLGLALIATLLSLPLSYLSIKNWLDNFTYQVDLNPLVFVSSALMLIIFSWVAVLYHAWKLATLNPVEFIRND